MKQAILNEYALNGYTVNSNLPIGTPIAWLSDVLPIGFLAFDGKEYNQSDYPELYNVVKNIPEFQSETEGKFKIPNLKGRVLQGADTVIGELIEAGLPNITSKFTARAFNTDALLLGDLEGGIDVDDIASSNSITVSTTSRANRRYTLLASKGETKTDGTLKTADEPHVYGNSDTVQPSAFTVRWIIKATQYASLEQNAIDDSKITNANVWSASKIKEETMEIYSDEEVIIGYLIQNGVKKPIYRKVWFGEYRTIDIRDLHIQYLMKTDASFIQGTNYFMCNSISEREILTNTEKTTLNITGAGTVQMVYIEYTKTTD